MFCIKQNSKSDCGITCLKIVLANLKRDKNYLYLATNEKKKTYSFLDLCKIADNHGVTLKGYRYEDDLDLAAIDSFPCIISINNLEGDKHSIVLYKKKKEKILILDPEKGKYWLDIFKLNSIWDGYILKVEENLEDLNPPTIFKDLIKRSKLIILGGFQIISSISLLCSFYFINGTYNGLIYALLFILLSLVFGFLFRLFLNKVLSEVSQSLVNKLKSVPTNSLEFISRLSNFKKNYFEPKMSLITNGMTIILLSVIFIYNAKMNALMILFSLLIAVISHFLFKEILRKLNEKVAKKESQTKAEEINDYLDYVNDIESHANKYALLSHVFNLIEGAMLIGGIVFVNLNLGILSSVSLLFYFALSHYLLQSFKNLFAIEEKEEVLDNSKSLLANCYYK